MRSDLPQFLTPEVMSRLGNLNLVARLVVEGFLTGLHRSPYHGFSVEFAEHRQYMPGDDIKYLDWKVFGKTDRYYVKEFEEETNLKSTILLDCSASMGYRSGQISKLRYGALLSAALAYLMLHQRDAVGLVTFDEQIRKFLPPRSVHSYLNRILHELDAADSGSGTRVGQTFHQLADRISRRGLIIVLSDLFDDPQSVMTGLKHFRHKKHEVIVFHLLDPSELDFGFKQAARFEDMESGEKLTTQPWHIRADYQRQVAEFVAAYRRQCREQRIDYIQLRTSEPFDHALLGYLIKRKKIGG
ncbi:MAG TPA: DUF58 domain-containing protein [bacterium]|jgi:uncharacterized protein (DUF58 family)|nr:DUF58 domain-containing protein [bacterium]HPG46664.1 DUF58 domain-containing protein [bacterium]HPM98803.1 DUF58 domain-containing protein [bacterium]